MNKMKPSQLDHVVTYFFFYALPFTIIVMGAFHCGLGRYFGGDFAARGQFGEQFGALNVLFTGAVFLGLVLTTALQAKGIREQNRALELQQEAQEQANRLSRLALLMEARRMEMDIVLKRVDGAASESEREAALREAKEIADRAAGEVEARLVAGVR